MTKKLNFLNTDSTIKSLNVLNEQLYPKAFYRKSFFKKEDIFLDENYNKAKRVVQLDAENFTIPFLPSKKSEAIIKSRGKSLIYSKLTLIRSKKLVELRGFHLFSNSFSSSCNQVLGILSSVLNALLNLFGEIRKSKKEGSKLEKRKLEGLKRSKFFHILILNPRKGGFDAVYNGLLGFLPRTEYRSLSYLNKKKLFSIFKNLFSLYAYLKSKFLFLIRVPIKRVILKVIQNYGDRKLSRRILRKRTYDPTKRTKLLRIIRPIFLFSPKQNKVPVLKVQSIQKVYQNVIFINQKVWGRKRSVHRYERKIWNKSAIIKSKSLHAKSKESSKQILQRSIRGKES